MFLSLEFFEDNFSRLSKKSSYIFEGDSEVSDDREKAEGNMELKVEVEMIDCEADEDLEDEVNWQNGWSEILKAPTLHYRNLYSMELL